MAKHGEGLGLEIVKGVKRGEIIEPITAKKVKEFCKTKGITATENHMSVVLPNASENDHSSNYKNYFERVARGEYRVLDEYRDFININEENEKNWFKLVSVNKAVEDSLKDTSEERKKRLKQLNDKYPKFCFLNTKHFLRNPDVIAEVLERANGICEKCGLDAPFTRASDNSPYLEVHHKIPLSEGGEDTVENTIAVCPNCHRELHFGLK